MALTISGIFTPPLIAALAIFYISYYYSDSFIKLTWWSFVGTFLLVGPASGYILYGLRKGSVSDINLSEREERLRPLVLALTGAVAGAVFLLVKEAPKQLILLNLVLISELVVVIVVTLFWKISMHALIYSSIVTMLAYLYDLCILWLMVLLIPIGWARLYRKRHTLLQVIMGSVAGAVVALGVFLAFGYLSK